VAIKRKEERKTEGKKEKRDGKNKGRMKPVAEEMQHKIQKSQVDRWFLCVHSSDSDSS